MELDEAAKSATAALFTLSLHSTQVEAGAARDDGGAAHEWGGASGNGAPAGSADTCSGRLEPGAWDAFWGWDCVAPGGLCERVYEHLGLPRSAWPGLKQVVEAPQGSQDEQDALRAAAARFRQALDAQLGALPPPRVGGPPRAAGEKEPAQASAEAAAVPDPDADEDSRADLAREREREAAARKSAADVLKEPISMASMGSEAAQLGTRDDVRLGDLAAATEPVSSERSSQHSSAPDQAAGSQPLGAAPQHGGAVADTGMAARAAEAVRAPPADDTKSASELAAAAAAAGNAAGGATAAGQPAVSAAALAAVTELLRACLAAARMPSLEQVAAEAKAKAKEEGAGAEEGGAGAPAAKEGSGGVGQAAEEEGAGVNVRWYDARARVALVRLAEWVGVPWDKVALYEQLLAEQAQPAVQQAGGGVKQAAQSGGMAKYAKIGAAAVGGGALIAITGGLAAPALAALAGPVMGTVGLGAVGGAASGFLASSAGAATVIAGMGAYGGHYAGSRMAHRIGDVKEFGFWEVPEDGDTVSRFSQAAPASPAPATQPESRAAEGAAGADSRAAALAAEQHAEEERLAALRLADTRRVITEEPAQQSEQGGGLAAAAIAAVAEAGPGLAHIEAGSKQEAEELAQVEQGEATEPAHNEADPAAAAAASAGGSKGSGSSWWPFGSKESTKEKADAGPRLLPIPVPTQQRADPRMALVIGVAGWVAHREDYVDVWRHLGAPGGGAERFSLVWESAELMALNSALRDFITAQATGAAAKWFLAQTVAAGLLAAVATPLAIVGATKWIDGTWAVAMDRAAKTGRLLAHVLMSGAHGDRPVTLVGYSMGARAIFHCLLELCRCNCKGVVEHAVLLGAPVSPAPERWRMARRVVAGRLVSGHSANDWVLGLVYGGSSGFVTAAAGVRPVEGAPGVENADLGDTVGSHFDYTRKMDAILDRLGFAQQAAAGHA